MHELTLDEIERAIRKQQNAPRRKKLQNLLHTRLEVVGLQRQDYIDIIKEMQPLLPDVEEEFIWLNLLQDLWEADLFEARLLGLKLLYFTPDLVDAHLWGMLEHWNTGVDNWVLADWLGHVRSIAIYKSPSLVMRMAPWLQSIDPWRRRSALVSLVYIDPRTMDKKLLLEAQEVFAFMEPIMEETQDPVQKAMAWLLKLVSEIYPDEFSSFIKQTRKRLPRKVLHLAKSALPAGMQQKV